MTFTGKIDGKEFTVNVPVIKRWVEDLRSGKFQQCKGRLTDGTGFCCLGVLEEQAVEAGVAFRKEHSETGTASYVDRENATFGAGSQSYLTTATRKWSGLPSSDPTLVIRIGEDSLAKPASAWNDNEDLTFSEIADLIEATYLQDNTEEKK